MIFEWFIVLSAVVVISGVARSEGRSPVAWGAITLGLSALCSEFLPWPFLRVMLGTGAAFVMLFVANAMGGGKKSFV